MIGSLDLQAEEEWTEIEAAYERLRENTESWAEYLGELLEWDTVSADPGDAAREWPEHNR